MKGAQVVVGARGSVLSVAQTESVISALRMRHPGYSFRLETITTLGDRVKQWRRSDTGIFVKEIEEALLKRKIDIAVHSVKDLPSRMHRGLVLAAVTRREDPRDVLISNVKCGLFDLPHGCRIGTSSLRRMAQILHVRPDVRVVELRGNLDTRIRKLREGNYDAIIVAAAGLRRLGIRGLCARPVPETLMLPAAGQGALAIEIRKGDSVMRRLVKPLDDCDSHACVESERSFLSQSRAGCRMPVAAFASIRGPRMALEGMIISLDGKKMIRLSSCSPIRHGSDLGRRLARQVLRMGGADILREIRNGQ